MKAESQGMKSINTVSEAPFPCLCVRGKEDRDVEGLKCVGQELGIREKGSCVES